MSLDQEIRLAPDDQSLIQLTSGPPDVTFIITNISPDAPVPKIPQTIALRLHKSLLGHVSDYYNSLFTLPMRDLSQDTFTFYYSDPSIYQVVLESIYGKRIRTTNWRVLLSIIGLARFLLIKTADEESLLSNIYLKPDEIVEYLQTALAVYPEEIPVNLLEHAARMLRSEVDLTPIPDEIIEFLLSSDKYQPSNEMMTYRMVENLVRQGRDPNLYQLVRIKSIPASIRQTLPEQNWSPLRRPSADEASLVPDLMTGSLLRVPINVLVIEPPSLSSFTNELQMYVRGGSKTQQVRVIIQEKNPGEIMKGDLIRLIDYSYRMGPYGDLYLEVDRYEPF